MTLYYDTLIPYMPDAVQGEDGELVADNQKASGRKAMMELANFQNTGNTVSLYQSIIYACTYADVDLVDTLLNIPEDINFEDGRSVTDILDEAAKLLFRSIKPSESFDIYRYSANVLMATHVIINTNSAEKETPLPSDATDT